MSSKSGHCEEDVDSESSRRRGESFQTLRQQEERMLVRSTNIVLEWEEEKDGDEDVVRQLADEIKAI
jgi:hypothetical protein